MAAKTKKTGKKRRTRKKTGFQPKVFYKALVKHIEELQVVTKPVNKEVLTYEADALQKALNAVQDGRVARTIRSRWKKVKAALEGKAIPDYAPKVLSALVEVKKLTDGEKAYIPQKRAKRTQGGGEQEIQKKK